MRSFLALFLPAYWVTLVAVPVAFMLDHIGRGATVLLALAILPMWVAYTAFFALIFVLPAAGLALLLRRVGGDWWQSGIGRLLYTLLCAGLGTALMMLTLRQFALTAAAAGGTAAWLSTSPDWPPRWRYALVVMMGLAPGLLLGAQYY